MTIKERSKLIKKDLLQLNLVKKMINNESNYLGIYVLNSSFLELDKETLNEIEKIIDLRIKQKTEDLQEV